MLIRDMIEESVKKGADLTAIKWLEKKEEKGVTYTELLNDLKAIRRGLLAEGFSGEHISLIGNTSAEWVETYMGVVTGQTTAVPLDVGLPIEDITDMIDRSDSTGVFLGKKNASMADDIFATCKKVRKIWILSKEDEDTGNEKVSTLKDLMSKGDEDAPAPSPDDVAMIIFTSGTTGKSKGVMLTQNNISSNVESVHIAGGPGDIVSLSVLPVHHAFCLVMEWLKGFQMCATLCINDSLLRMMKNIGVFKPNTILMVPLMIETIFKRIQAAGDVDPEEIYETVLGGSLKSIYSGGAHLDPYYIDEFKKYGVGIYEGYGMSECSPVIASNTVEDHKDGSIGRPLKNVEVKFVDGEIMVRGSSVMKGYYHMEKETAETIEDGWLHTGDLGYMDDDGFLFINGRAKNLIILSNGENVSPEEMEGKLALDDLVSEVIVTGEDTGLAARIYPDPDVAKNRGLDEAGVEQSLRSVIDEFNKTQPTYRQIVSLIVRKYPFIKNATRKIKRTEVLRDEPVEE